MEQEEIVYLQKLRKAHTERLRVLELQAAQLGITCPPNILTEIEQIKDQITAIDLKIQRTVKCPECKSGLLDIEINEDIKTYIPGLLRKINISASFLCKECGYAFTLNTFRASKKYVNNHTKLISPNSGITFLGLAAVVAYLKKQGVSHTIAIVDTLADTHMSEGSEDQNAENSNQDENHEQSSDSLDVDLNFEQG